MAQRRLFKDHSADNRKRDSGLLYQLFVEDIPHKSKIGRTGHADMAQRLREIKTTGIPGHWLRETILYRGPDYIQYEKRLHHALRMFRINGGGVEWFNMRIFLAKTDPFDIARNNFSDITCNVNTLLFRVATRACKELGDYRTSSKWSAAFANQGYSEGYLYSTALLEPSERR